MPKTLEQHKQQARELAAFSKTTSAPCAFEVVKPARRTADGEEFIVQPFGMHALFKSHRLVHVEPIPA